MRGSVCLGEGRGSPPPRAGQRNLSPLATERTSSIGAFESGLKKTTKASSPLPNGAVTCTHETDAGLMGLCSLSRRPGQPAPRMERGQLTLETTTPLPPPFSLQTKPVTLCSQGHSCQQLQGGLGGRPEVTRHCLLGEKLAPSRPEWQPSLLKWAGCAEFPGGEVIPTPPRTVLSGTGIPKPVSALCWAP